MKNIWLDKNKKRRVFYIDVDVDVDVDVDKDEVDDFIKRLKYEFKTRAVK